MGIVGLYSTGYGEILEVDESLVDRYISLGWLPIGGGGGGGGVTDFAVAQQVTSGTQTKGALDAAYTATVLTATTATSSAALAADRHTPVDATSGPLTMTLPSPTRVGQQIRVEKVDSSANIVTVTGTLRGAASSVPMPFQYEVRTFIAESLSSWRIASGNTPKTALDATYGQRWRPNTAYLAGTIVQAPDGRNVVAKVDFTSGATYDASNWSVVADAFYGRITSVRPGNLAVYLGDSLTAGADDPTNQAGGAAWPVFASIYSGQRLQYARNAGIPGNTTAAMLARFDTDVTPYKPTVVTLLCGTNDTGVTSFAAWQASFLAIVAKIRAIGAVPVLATMPPTNATTPVNRRREVVAWNAYIKRFAALNGLACLDFYSLLVDPANGNFKAAYFNDGIHPNAAGAAAMGKYASDLLTPLLATLPPLLTSDDTDENNALGAGCFTAGTGSALPSGWSDGAGAPSGSAISYTTDPAVAGQMVTITQTSTAVRQLVFASYMGATTLSNAVAAGATSLVLPVRADFRGVLFIGSGATFEVVRIQSSSGAGPQTEALTHPLLYAHAAGEPVIINGIPGDEMVYSGVITSDGGVPVTTSVVCQGGSLTPAPMSALTFPVTRGVFSRRFTIPAGTTQLQSRLQAGAGTGVVSFGQVGLFNATRLSA